MCARPKVAVIATGAELVEPGRALAAGEIPDSNSVMVAGLVTAAGAELVTVARCGDEPGALSELLAGLPQVDVIFTTGGVVSVGIMVPEGGPRRRSSIHARASVSGPFESSPSTIKASVTSRPASGPTTAASPTS